MNFQPRQDDGHLEGGNGDEPVNMAIPLSPQPHFLIFGDNDLPANMDFQP